MINQYKPYDIGIWLDFLNANVVSDEKGLWLSKFNLSSEKDVRYLIDVWLRPEYLKWDELNRREMREVLEESKKWKLADLREQFDDAGLDGEDGPENIEIFLDLLREAFPV